MLPRTIAKGVLGSIVVTGVSFVSFLAFGTTASIIVGGAFVAILFGFAISSEKRPQDMSIDNIQTISYGAISEPNTNANTPAISSPKILDNFPKVIEIIKTCCVCEKEDDLLLTHCMHTICLECYNALPVKICPLCRDNLKDDLMHRL